VSALGVYNYWIYIIVMMIGFYGVIAKRNLVKQVIALGLFQTAIFLFYISMAVVDGGTAPIWELMPDDHSQKRPDVFDNPLPHVLMLTAIVVGVSVMAVALAIIVSIKRHDRGRRDRRGRRTGRGPHVIAFNLPALVVIVPLLGGLISVLIGPGVRSWCWSSIVSAATFAAALALYGQVGGGATVSYPMGSWLPEYGIAYHIDALNAFILLVVSGVAFVCTLYARLSVAQEIPADRLHIFYGIWLLALAGLLGITITGDAFNVYVLLEVSSLTVYTLIAMGRHRDRRALTASLRYLIIGSIGASFILLGIGYLLMVTGTLNMADMRAQLEAMPDAAHNRTVQVAFAFLLVGLSLKMALFPLHMWLPNAYAYAPSAVSAFIAATATKVGIYLAFRFLFDVFGYQFAFVTFPSHMVLLLCASFGIILASLAAIKQRNIKRMLAYSSVAQIGYMVLGFALANVDGLTGSVVHIGNHALMKGGMFLALGAVVYRLGGADLDRLRGLGRRMPWTMAAFTAGGMGLIGFPLTAGFISKWYLVKGALAADMWPLALVVLVGSLLALVYVWRVVEAVYFQEPSDQRSATVREAPASLLVPTWFLIGASIYFGIDATLTVGAAQEAARAMLPTALQGALP